MTAANGLGALAAYTRLVATAFAQQAGFVPTVGGPASPSVDTGGGADPPVTAPTAPGARTPTAAPTRPPSDVPSPIQPSVDVPTVFTKAAHSISAGLMLPFAVLASLVFTLIAIVIHAISSARATSSLQRRLAQATVESRNRT